MNILFLDSSTARWEIFKTKFPDARLVTTSDECIYALRQGDNPSSGQPKTVWDLVSLDYDLALGDNGGYVVNALRLSRPIIRFVVVHSTNLVEGLRMTKLIREYGYDTTYVPFNSNPGSPFSL